MIRSLIVALLMAAPAALAEDVALVVGNGSYDNARGLRGADDVAATAEAFEAAGFRVLAGEDLTAEALRGLAAEFAAAADGSGRIAVALAGHFVRSGHDTWFLGTDTDRPDLFGAAADGLLLSTLLEVAGRAPGRAVVLLGTEDRSIRLGDGLAPGILAGEVPQGVALIRGDAREVADFVTGALLAPGRPLGAAVAERADLTATGFLPRDLPFLAEAAAPEPEPEPARQPAPEPAPQAERTAWAAALAQDTVEGYEAFLRAYPGGTNAALARQAIRRLGDEAGPEPDARRAEAALGLGRDARRAIQRNLSLLGYETGGIDGIFGPATRRAIAAWQRTNDEAPTGFLTRAEIDRIDAQAIRRAAELEAEAEARRAELEREDRAWWDRTGALGGEENLRAYLRRYPEGLYADVATEALAPFDEERRAEARAADRLAWEVATEQDSVAAYRAYLDDQPEGAFRAAAEERIAALSLNQNAAAERAEAALGLNAFTRNLVEGRLDALGLDPGRIDGTFDSRTRRAIRRYQAARNLPATGFLSQDTVVRLLADSILR